MTLRHSGCAVGIPWSKDFGRSFDTSSHATFGSRATSRSRACLRWASVADVYGCQNKNMPRKLFIGRFCNRPPGSRRARRPRRSVTALRYAGSHARISNAHNRWVCMLLGENPPPSSSKSRNNSGAAGVSCACNPARNASGAASASNVSTPATEYQRCHGTPGAKTRPTTKVAASCAPCGMVPSVPRMPKRL